MSILSDKEILKRCVEDDMINPFEKTSVKTQVTEKGEQRIISYGLSSYGYDMVLSKNELKIFSNANGKLVDARKADPESYYTPPIQTDEDGLEYVVLPPGTTMLGHTRETFKIPRDVLGVCLGKSTYVRVGVSILVTPLEPEWTGQLVLEIINTLTSPNKIYVDQGIGQLVFHHANQTCDTSYADRGGKYQNQVGTVDAKV